MERLTVDSPPRRGARLSGERSSEKNSPQEGRKEKKKIWRQPDSGSAYSGKSAGDKLNKPRVQEDEDLRPGEGGAWYNM